MSGGLRPRPAIRTRRLEVLADDRERALEGLSAPARHWRRALELSPEEEVAELERLAEVANAQEDGSLAALEADLAVLALQERIMFRASPILAADLRLKRDLLARALRHHAGEAERVNDADGPEWWSAVRAVFRAAKARGADNVEVARAMREEIDRLDDRARALSGLLREREQLVRGGVAEPVGDPQEALRMAEEAVAAAEDASSTKH